MLDDLVKGLEAEAPVAARRAIAPEITRHVRTEVVLRAFESNIFRHRIKSSTVCQLQVVDLLDVTHTMGVLDHKGEECDVHDP